MKGSPVAKTERWEFLAETKEAAIDLLLKRQRLPQGLKWSATLSDEEYSEMIRAVDRMDLSLPPPVGEGEALCAGWRWLVKVVYDHIEQDSLYAEHFYDGMHVFRRHEWSVSRVQVAFIPPEP